jgi:hypothetical protein
MKNIFSAFVKAQSAIGKAEKSAINPHLKSKYANLESVMDCIKPALEANGLGFVQKFHDCEGGIKIETVILHESGEELSCGILSIPASKQDAQGYGSAITYAKRYGILAAFGVSTGEPDDDGHAAARSAPAKKAAKAEAEIIWLPDQATSEVIAAKDDAALTAVYKKWLDAATKSGEKEYLVTMCKARKEDLQGEKA